MRKWLITKHVTRFDHYGILLLVILTLRMDLPIWTFLVLYAIGAFISFFLERGQ